jgi:multiple sugar transport system substrate-binding protein
MRGACLNPNLLDGKIDLWRDVASSWKLLMIDEGPWYYSILMNSSDLKIDLLKATLPAPFPTDGEYGSIIGGESLVLTKGSRHKDEAWLFIRWMMRKETQRIMFKAGLIPTNMDAFNDYDAGLKSDGYIGPYVEGLEKAFYPPSLPQWDKIGQLYDEAMEDIFVNERNVRDALNEAASAMDMLLAADNAILGK